MRRYILVIRNVDRGTWKVIKSDDMNVINHIKKNLDPSLYDWKVIDIFDADAVPMEDILEYIL